MSEGELHILIDSYLLRPLNEMWKRRLLHKHYAGRQSVYELDYRHLAEQKPLISEFEYKGNEYGPDGWVCHWKTT